MRILVTGGTGTVGTPVVTELARRGHDVRILSRHARAEADGWSANVEGVDGDVGDAASIAGCCEGCDAVLHLAAIVREDPPGATFDRINVGGTRSLLAEATRAGVRRFVYVSSLGAERGASAYHGSKRAAEVCVRDFAGNWTICRAGNVYGPGDDVVSLLLLWTRLLPAVPVIDDGEQPFQPVYAADLARGLTLAVERDDLRARVLELAGRERTSMSDLVRRLAAILGRDPVRVPVPHILASLGIKAAKHLGLGLPLDEGQITMLRERSVLSDGAENALVQTLGVAVTPLDDGLRALADAQPAHLPSDGRGALERKRYWADIAGSRLDAEALMRRLAERFDEVTPWTMDLAAEPGTSSRLEAGVTLTMELPAGRRVQVRVVEVEPHCVTVVTVRGHPLAGAVRFLVEPRGDRVRFEVQTYHRASSLADWLVMHPLGAYLQATNWTALVERMLDESGGGAPDGVQSAEATLDDDQAREVEEWVARLVREQLRAERAAGARPVPARTPQPPVEPSSASP